jgi:cytochrome c
MGFQMKRTIIVTAAAFTFIAGTALAEGDAEKGKKDFKKCRACHTVASEDEVFLKGGKIGPNLFGTLGRQAGTVEEYKYGASIVAAGESGLIWTEELMISYIADPKGFLKEYLDDSGAKAKMTFKMKDSDEVDAYLASLAP